MQNINGISAIKVPKSFTLRVFRVEFCMSLTETYGCVICEGQNFRCAFQQKKTMIVFDVAIAGRACMAGGGGAVARWWKWGHDFNS